MIRCVCFQIAIRGSRGRYKRIQTLKNTHVFHVFHALCSIHFLSVSKIQQIRSTLKKIRNAHTYPYIDTKHLIFIRMRKHRHIMYASSCTSSERRVPSVSSLVGWYMYSLNVVPYFVHIWLYAMKNNSNLPSTCITAWRHGVYICNVKESK